MTDIVTELLDFTTRDHERGCTGREYVCSCGYDNEIEAAVKKASAEIEHLRLSLSEARATGRREGISEAADILLSKAAGLRANENPTSTAMAMIFEEQAAAIRAAMEKEE